jgi:hypothetical protein
MNARVHEIQGAAGAIESLRVEPECEGDLRLIQGRKSKARQWSSTTLPAKQMGASGEGDQGAGPKGDRRAVEAR